MTNSSADERLHSEIFTAHLLIRALSHDLERPAIIKAIAAAREHGDLSENAEYTSARERQGSRLQ